MHEHLPQGSPKLRVTGALTVKSRGAPPLARTARMTVLFADLRGYTGLAERLDPASVVPLMDEFFGVVAAATTANGGTVFHVAGDGLMAGFGGERDDTNGAREALCAGNAMLQNFGLVAARWRHDLGIETGIGVGLHFGLVAKGLLGPPGRRPRGCRLPGDRIDRHPL